MIDINQKHYRMMAVFYICLLIIYLYGFGLGFPSKQYYDEEHYVKFVRHLIYDHQYDVYSNNHPPLFHLLTAVSIKLLGDVSYAWRVVSFGAGLGVLLMTYMLAKKISNDSFMACFAVFFSVFDFISLTQARIAMMSSLVLFFMLLSLWSFLRAFSEEDNVKVKELRNAGVFFGLAISTKLISLNLLAFFILIFFVEMKKKRVHRPLFFKFLNYFVLVPIVIFIGSQLFIPFLKNGNLAQIWDIFMFNIKYHSGMRQAHPYASMWWSWPLMLRPIWFYFESQGHGLFITSVRGIICIGNPVIFWMIPVAVGNLLWDYFKTKSRIAGYILFGFLLQWMIYSFSKRLHMFHYFYYSMPFVSMAFALLASKIWRINKIGKGVIVAYCLLVIVMFVYWYPLLVGVPINYDYFAQHMWFKSWI